MKYIHQTKIIGCLFYLSMISLCLAAMEMKNILLNGDFTSGSMRWSGGKLYTDNGNKCVYIELKKEEEFYLNQTFRSPAASPTTPNLEIKFRYKTTPDYEGNFEVDLKQPNPEEENDRIIIAKGFSPKPNTDWKNVTWVIKALPPGKNSKFEFKIKSGKGRIYFDDVSLTPTDAPETPE